MSGGYSRQVGVWGGAAAASTLIMDSSHDLLLATNAKIDDIKVITRCYRERQSHLPKCMLRGWESSKSKVSISVEYVFSACWQEIHLHDKISQLTFSPWDSKSKLQQGSRNIFVNRGPCIVFALLIKIQCIYFQF